MRIQVPTRIISLVLLSGMLVSFSPATASQAIFAQRRAGVFDPLLPAQAVQDLGAMKGFLWYFGFATDPRGDQDENSVESDADRFFSETRRQGIVPEIGFEPSFIQDGQQYYLHLGTLSWALPVDDLAGQVLAINQALDQQGDPLQALSPRVEDISALHVDASGREEWKTVRVDLNRFLVSLVRWGRYFAALQSPVILRPLSEMNDETAGAWCFGKHPENTPEAYAQTWNALVHILRWSGADQVAFAFAPVAVGDAALGKDSVLEAANRILDANPSGIDAFGMDAYTTADPQGHPISFESIVTPWIRALRGTRLEGLPLIIPEMGIDRTEILSDALRSQWISDAFQTAKRLGFSYVIYYHSTNAPMDFTVLPRPGSPATPGERGGQALRQGIIDFQGS